MYELFSQAASFTDKTTYFKLIICSKNNKQNSECLLSHFLNREKQVNRV